MATWMATSSNHVARKSARTTAPDPLEIGVPYRIRTYEERIMSCVSRASVRLLPLMSDLQRGAMGAVCSVRLEPVLSSVCEAYHDPQEHACRARNRAERS